MKIISFIGEDAVIGAPLRIRSGAGAESEGDYFA